MEDNSTQGGKSSHDFHADSSTKNNLSIHSANSSSSTKKELSKVVFTDIINPDKDLISFKQSTPSATAAVISIEESVKETNSKFEESGSKSKTSFETSNVKSNSVSRKTSSMKSERVGSNHLSRINSKEIHLDQASHKSSWNRFGGGNEETATLKSADTEKTNVSSLHCSDVWAKSSTSCIPTAFQSTKQSNEVKNNFDNSKCIPPWAKTIRGFYGVTSSNSGEEVLQENLQEKIKSLMEKHSRLMLIKRGESRKQIILEPNEYGDVGKVKVATKNTRYYMSPIPRDAFRENIENKTSAQNFSPEQSHGSSMLEMTKKTSKYQAKKEVTDILKSLYNSKTQRESVKQDIKLKKEPTICPKITPSNIRDYVKAQTLDPDSQKLHEIIKIKKVPSFGTQVGRKPSSKYIINVPRVTKGDGPTVNKITVKEKRKIRIDSAEDINENVTQIVYNSDPQDKKEGGYKADKTIQHDVVPYSKQHKSPTKTRTLEVTAERTPIISDMVKKEEKDKDKILLIQYEKKSRPGKEKSDAEQPTLVSTQLFGIRKPCNEDVNEMYLYGTERDGKKCKETITQVDDVSPTLREKVNMIFQELRDMTFKPCEEFESSPESKPSVTSKTTQHPSMLVETDAVSIQAIPDVRSTEVQVTDSLLFFQRQSKAEQETMKSEGDKKKRLSSVEDEITDPTDDLAVLAEDKQKKPYYKESTDEDTTQETDDIEKESPETDDEVVISEVEEKKQSGESKRSTEDGQVQEEEHSEETEHGDTKSEAKSDQSEIKSIEDQEELEERSLEDDYDEHMSDKAEEQLEMLPEEEKEETMNDVFSVKETSSSEDDHHSERIEELEGDIEQDSRKESHTSAGHEDSYHRESGNMEKPFFSEDIRSYDFDPAQDYELKMISSSKFFHQRDSLRKLNWTEDIIYLENNLCPQLTKALAEIAVKQPEDPISYLAHWIYKEYENREDDEKISVFKEHLEVAKGMIISKNDPELVCKKFSVRRYPLKSHSTVELTVSKTSDIAAEEEPDTEDLE